MKPKKIIKTIFIIVLVLIIAAILAVVINYRRSDSWRINHQLKQAWSKNQALSAQDLLGPQNEDAYLLLLAPETPETYIDLEDAPRTIPLLDLKWFDGDYVKLIVFDTSGVLKNVKVYYGPLLKYNSTECLKYSEAYFLPYPSRFDNKPYYLMVTKAEAEDIRFQEINKKLIAFKSNNETIKLNDVLNINEADDYFIFLSPYRNAKHAAESIYENSRPHFSKDFLADIIAQVPQFKGMRKLVVFNKEGVITDVFNFYRRPLFYHKNFEKCMKLSDTWLILEPFSGTYTHYILTEIPE